MIDWLDEFYSSPETRQLLEESYAPLFAEYGAAVAAIAGAEVGVTPAVSPFISAIASTYVNNYLDSSRAQLQEMLSAPDPRAAIEQRLTEWAEKRPGKVAQEATVQTSNAVTQTVYKDAGITRKKWNARGKSCPYCKRMNGKVVGIDRPFHREGDSIEVPDSEISAKAKLNFTHEIGHPPQHAGCDCVIEADMASQVIAEPEKGSVAWAQEHFGPKSGDYYKNLTPDELLVMQKYSGSYFRQLNRYSRRGAFGTNSIPIQEQRVGVLDGVINRRVTDRALIVQRTSSYSAFGGYDPRGFIGKTITDKGYMSTSLGKPPWDGLVHFNITVPRGTPAAYMSPVSVVKGEKELLLGRNTQMRVDAVRAKKKGSGSRAYEIFEVDVTIVP